MTPELARFIANVATTFRGLSVESLYQVALGLRHELERRELDCTPEADALVAAMLAHARIEHRAIFSEDCCSHRCRPTIHDATCVHAEPNVEAAASSLRDSAVPPTRNVGALPGAAAEES